MLCRLRPVMEKAIAQKAGLGWIGKHSNLLDRTAGSWFFLGEFSPTCPAGRPPTHSTIAAAAVRIDCCPTQAIVAPYQVDARRCISYHHRTQGCNSACAAAAAGQPHLRLRRLPAGFAMEPVCHPLHRNRTSCPETASIPPHCANCLPGMRVGLFASHPRVGYPAHRLPALAATLRWRWAMTDSADAVGSLGAQRYRRSAGARTHQNGRLDGRRD